MKNEFASGGGRGLKRQPSRQIDKEIFAEAEIIRSDTLQTLPVYTIPAWEYDDRVHNPACAIVASQIQKELSFVADAGKLTKTTIRSLDRALGAIAAGRFLDHKTDDYLRDALSDLYESQRQLLDALPPWVSMHYLRTALSNPNRVSWADLFTRLSNALAAIRRDKLEVLIAKKAPFDEWLASFGAMAPGGHTYEDDELKVYFDRGSSPQQVVKELLSEMIRHRPPGITPGDVEGSAMTRDWDAEQKELEVERDEAFADLPRSSTPTAFWLPKDFVTLRLKEHRHEVAKERFQSFLKERMKHDPSWRPKP